MRQLKNGRLWRAVATCLAVLVAAATLAAQPSPLTLPVAADSVRFMVIGDNGTGKPPQYETADQMATWHTYFPFTFVLMCGDNMYGRQNPSNVEKKFARPYKALLDADVEFQASLGNHDNVRVQLAYPPLHMDGQRYRTFVKGHVRFFALDSTRLGRDASSRTYRREQRQWLARELAHATEPWKIAFFHHPLYSSGKRHGSELEWRNELEPILIEGGVQVVFAGHDHFYERIVPQKGIHHFVTGSSGQLRDDNIHPDSPLTAAGFDTDRAFLLVEIAGDTLHFQAVSRTGATVDSGTIERTAVQPAQ